MGAVAWIHGARSQGSNRLLKNYLRCLAVVKNSLKMLIYST